MPKINSSADLGAIKEHDEFRRQVSPVIKETVDTINGKLEFDTNMNTQTVSVVFPSANADVAVSHDMGRTGLKYLVGSKSVDCSVYNGSKTQTKNIIYLRSTQPATVTVVLF